MYRYYTEQSRRPGLFRRCRLPALDAPGFEESESISTARERLGLESAKLRYLEKVRRRSWRGSIGNTHCLIRENPCKPMHLAIVHHFCVSGSNYLQVLHLNCVLQHCATMSAASSQPVMAWWTAICSQALKA